MRTTFFGTPAIALPALAAVAETTELVGVVSQPSRPAGRGLAEAEPPVARWARAHGVPCLQPAKVRDGALLAWLEALRPDAAIVLAYGRILPPAVLAAPRLGCWNLHASLLPRWRGAAPIPRAIEAGDTETGISLMMMDEGLDTGPVAARRSVAIGSDDTAGTLEERLAALAAAVVRDDLPRALAGALPPVAQDPGGATLAPPLEPADARLDWGSTAAELARRVRAFQPRPGAHTQAGGVRLRVLEAREVPIPVSGPPGTVTTRDGRILVQTGGGALEILRAQVEGRRALPARDLVNGRAVRDGAVLGAAPP
ncbi:MAG: methionyl-tRNA formyltransferase [Polyangiaceae bacterium]|nr:methionyl-tRNA formyltransferase [Polyangiaceae bacterium]